MINLSDVLSELYEACRQKRLKELKSEILCPCGKENPDDCSCEEVEESMTFPRKPGKTYSRIKGVPERPKATQKKPMSNKEIVNDIINNYADGTPRKKIKEGAFKNQDVLKKDKAVLRDRLAGEKDENKKKAIHQQIKSIQSQIKEDEELDLEEEVNIFFDEDTEEIFIESDLLEDGTEVELDEDLISEMLGEDEIISEKIDRKRRRIVIRVNSKGKRTRKIICGKGMITKKVNGSVRCIRMTGAAKMRKRMGQRKRLRTLKRKGAGFQRRLNIKRQRAMRRRKAMGLKPKRGK